MNIFKKIWQGYINFRKRSLNAEFNMNHISQQIDLKCPKCGSYLYRFTGEGVSMQLYACRKCGYQGSIGLFISEKSKKKRRKA